MRFSSITGQSGVKQKLVSGADTGRIPHAQLFLGAPGAGALPLALAYATYVNCTDRKSGDSCGECHSCRKMETLTHPDVHFTFPFPSSKGDFASELYAEWRKALIANPYMNYDGWMSELGADNKQGNIPIRECRAIISNLSMKHYEADYKILIMWLPEYLGQEGNVLLKMIEEPPAKTLFLLVAEKTDRILTTILSRTQMVRIPPVMENDVADFLIAKHGMDPENAGRIAMMCGGNLVLAVQLAAESESRFFEPFTSLMRLCYKYDVSGMMAWAEEQASLGREQLKGFMLYSLELIRAALTSRYLGARTGLNEAESAFMEGFSQKLNNRKIDMLYDVINSCVYEIERNANAKIVLSEAAIKISKIFR